MFNVNALSQSLHQQAEINRQTAERLERLDTPLYFELMHNLVVEFTRVTIEVKNTKMRVESIASRLEFNERRARALESVVMYKPAEESSRTERMDTSERNGPPERSNRPQSDGRLIDGRIVVRRFGPMCEQALKRHLEVAPEKRRRSPPRPVRHPPSKVKAQASAAVGGADAADDEAGRRQ